MPPTLKIINRLNVSAVLPRGKRAKFPMTKILIGTMVYKHKQPTMSTLCYGTDRVKTWFFE